MVKSARGTAEEPGQSVAQKSGLNRSTRGLRMVRQRRVERSPDILHL
ncbi:hypothetical protein [Streptomyces sp. AK04-3B]|nr:hypothetical protein [Streptomyces sp. AK04-3B]MDX3799148.1 hypothetical protein [Streptomyces sp. AK04-3B]